VLQFASLGLSNQQIAERLGISRGGVRYHLKELHSKLETGSQRAILRARGWGRHTLVLVALTSKSLVASGATALMVASTVGAAYLAYDHFHNGARGDDGPWRTEGFVSYVTWEGATLSAFADGRTTIDDLRRLNPQVSDGPLPAGIEVRVPRLAGDTTLRAQPTVTYR
jgi:hypothetical protein